EEDPVLVSDEEVPGRAGLAPELVQDGPDLVIHVRELVEQRARALEVVAVPAEVRRDERRLGVLAEEVVPLLHERLEVDLVRTVVAPVGEERELQPPLVLQIERLVERRWLRGMDERRNIESGHGLPDRIELRIVDAQA